MEPGRSLSVPDSGRPNVTAGGPVASWLQAQTASGLGSQQISHPRRSINHRAIRYARSRYRFPKILSIAHLGPDLAILGP
jgi:hypothetical protein